MERTFDIQPFLKKNKNKTRLNQNPYGCPHKHAIFGVSLVALPLCARGCHGSAPVCKSPPDRLQGHSKDGHLKIPSSGETDWCPFRYVSRPRDPPLSGGLPGEVLESGDQVLGLRPPSAKVQIPAPPLLVGSPRIQHTPCLVSLCFCR